MIQTYQSSPQPVQVHGKREIRAQTMELMQSADGETLELRIYDEIKPDGYDWWTGEEIESETSADWFGKRLAEAPNATKINLFVNSVGGSVLEAMGIRAQLLRHKATKTGYVDGWAASAASFVLTACETVHMLTGSMQFLHNMRTIAFGDSRDLRQMAAEMDRMMASNREMYLERAGDKLTEDKLIEMLEAETWLTAQECVELGLATDVMAADEYRIIAHQHARAEPEQTAEEPPPDDTVAEPGPEIEPVDIEPTAEEQPDMAALFMSGFARTPTKE